MASSISPPERLVFVDETWASTKMARSHGRCPRGERLRMSVPHGHWKTTTVIAGLRATGIVAPFVIDCPVNRDVFETWVDKVLTPELKPGDVVGLDNLPQGAPGPGPHRGRPSEGPLPSSLRPDFNPIENAFAKLKALLRKTAARTQDTLWDSIGKLVDYITPAEYANMLAAAGYDPC